MDDQRFWKIVEESRGSPEFGDALYNLLKGLPSDEIIGFANILQSKLLDAYTFSLLQANFVIQSYVSDDIFEGFRAWLVTQGRSRYESALVNPEAICDWLDRNAVEHLEGEPLLSIAESAYLHRHQKEDFANRIQPYQEPNITQTWPESKAEFRELMPRLVDRFWNQELINDIHSP